MNPRLFLLKDSHGSTAVTFIVLLVVFFGLLATVIDLGRLFEVKNELQNAADAAALGGARELFPLDTSTGNTMENPDWSKGRSVAAQAVKENKADVNHTYLQSGTIETGYWDANNPSAAKQALLPTTTSSPDPTHIWPAVRVTITKTAGSNSGPVDMTLGQVFGIKSVNVSAKATAVIAGPINAPSGTLFPLAIKRSLLDDFYFSNLGNSFYIGSSYHYRGDIAGQWTSFGVDDNSDNDIVNLEKSGNPHPVTLNGKIWIQPGTRTNCYANAANYKGKTVLLAVVSDIDTHTWKPCLGFVPFYIEAAVGGSGSESEKSGESGIGGKSGKCEESGKYIRGHFVSGFTVVNGSPGGPPWGAVAPLKLVQ
jgi:Putative Flp pilus-assembly TadE/G-like